MSAFSVASSLLLSTQVVLLTVAFVLMVVAERGYRGTPWGRVLQPMPVLIAAFLVTIVLRQASLSAGVYTVASTSLWSVGVAAMAVSIYRLNLMARGAYT